MPRLLNLLLAVCLFGSAVMGYKIPNMDEVHASMVNARYEHIQRGVDRVVENIKNKRNEYFEIDLEHTSKSECDEISELLQHDKFKITSRMFDPVLYRYGSLNGAQFNVEGNIKPTSCKISVSPIFTIANADVSA